MTSTVSGVITLNDELEHQQKLLSDPDFDPGFSQLYDATKVTKWELEATDVQTLAQKTVFSPHSRRAILIPKQTTFSYVRTFDKLRDSFGETGVHVFRDPALALAWVLAKHA